MRLDRTCPTCSCRTEKLKIDAQTRANTVILQSEADLGVATSKSLAMLESAQAEQAAIENLKEKRRYELEWERLEILKEFASKGRKFISGEQAQNLMDSMTSAAISR